MSYQVTARKWRPNRLDELVGQSHIAHALTNAIENDRIAHAYLFSGPRGVGKTSSARILAKSLNCEKGPTVDPCQQCSNCIEITNGSSYDVIEIDGASNRKIDDIREVRENVKYLPNKSKYKIIIIDEVHMLTDQAFNALLKTLEEPPAHVIFIFATTESHKVKITIRSRCQHYHFKRISTIDIQNQLSKIADAENIEIENQALYYIAKAADGSMRDSQSLFDQVIAYSKGKTTAQEVEEILGVFSEAEYIKFLDFLAKQDIISLLEQNHKIKEEGQSLFHFSMGIIDKLRSLLILKKCGESESVLLDISQESIEDLKGFLNIFDDEQILEMLNLTVQLNQDLKKASREDFLMESYLYRIIQYDNFIKPAKIIKRITEIEEKVLNRNTDLKIEENIIPEIVKDKNSAENKGSVNTEDTANQNNSIESFELNEKSWKKFIDLLYEKSLILFGTIEHVKEYSYNNGKIICVFDDPYFYEESNSSETKNKLTALFEELFSFRVQFEFELKEKSFDPKEEEQRKGALNNVLDTFKGTIISDDNN